MEDYSFPLIHIKRNKPGVTLQVSKGILTNDTRSPEQKAIDKANAGKFLSKIGLGLVVILSVIIYNRDAIAGFLLGSRKYN